MAESGRVSIRLLFLDRFEAKEVGHKASESWPNYDFAVACALFTEC